MDTKTALLSAGVAAAGVGFAVRQVRVTLEPRRMPLLGLAAAFVFAAQMLNFPVVGGTSGHLTGGVLTAVLLGPAAAMVVLTCVLVVQCLVFADGGLMALGANVFNMAILNVGVGYFAFWAAARLVRGNSVRSTVFAAAFAGWVGTVVASISVAGQLALSGTVPWGLAFPAMANVHMLIGIGEGLATGLITLAVVRIRPELVAGMQAQTTAPGWAWVPYGLLIAIGLAVFVAPFASPWPDGLESVAAKLGFEEQAGGPAIAAPFPDYEVPGLGSATWATAVAGLVGTVLAFGAAYLLARLLVPALETTKKDAPSGN